MPRFDAKPRIETHSRFPFFLRLEQAMQLVAVDDIGRLVAAVFADEARFIGQTLRLASDTVTGRDLQEALSEAAGRPIAYSRFPDEVLAGNPDLAHMSASLEHGPLAKHAWQPCGRTTCMTA